MHKIRQAFDSLPSEVKVLIYSGVSSFLAKLVADLQSGAAIDWRQYAIVPLTMAINVLAYLALKEKGE